MPMFRGSSNPDLERIKWDIKTMGQVSPSDFLSDEEVAKLSGPVRTYYLPGYPKPKKGANNMGAVQMSRPPLTREALEGAIVAGKTIPEIAEMFGVSPSTITGRRKAWRLRDRDIEEQWGGRTERWSLSVARARLSRQEAAALVSSAAQYLETGLVDTVRVDILIQEVPAS